MSIYQEVPAFLFLKEGGGERRRKRSERKPSMTLVTRKLSEECGIVGTLKISILG